MFEKILVATDGSGPATRAVELAARIAASTGSALLAVSVYHEPNPGTPLRPDSGPGIDVAKGLLEDVERRYGSRAAVTTFARPGDPADVILELAASEGAGLIVCGDRGMSGTRAVLGSVPNTISHHAPCNVLLAHTADGRVDEIPITSVLLATDGSPTATEAVRVGADFADALGAKAFLVTVGDANTGEKILDHARAAIGRSLEGRVVQGSVVDALIDEAEKRNADCLVTGSRGMQGARRLLGSVPNSVSHNARCSVFIAKTA